VKDFVVERWLINNNRKGANYERREKPAGTYGNLNGEYKNRVVQGESPDNCAQFPILRERRLLRRPNFPSGDQYFHDPGGGDGCEHAAEKNEIRH
jgi:hypothetical protein